MAAWQSFDESGTGFGGSEGFVRMFPSEFEIGGDEIRIRLSTISSIRSEVRRVFTLETMTSVTIYWEELSSAIHSQD